MKKYTKDDSFIIGEDMEYATTKLTEHFRLAGLKTAPMETGLRVRTGSDLLFRLFGAAMSVGAKNLPVAMDIRLSEEAHGTTVTSIAYDQLGAYMNEKLWWGGDELMNRKLESLLAEVRTALGQPTEPARPS